MARELLTAKGLASKLEEARAEAARKNTRIKIPDGDNLNLIVRANGGASWVLNYRLGSQRKPYTIGNWPGTTLAIARQRAQAVREKVALGIDPLEERRVELGRLAAERAEQQAEKDSVLDLMEDWLKKHPGSTVYKGNIRAAFKKDVLPEIGALDPQSVGRQECIKILRAIETRNSHDMVRRVRMWMRQMFDFGVDHESRPQLDRNPVPMGTLRSFAAHDPGNYAAITRSVDVAELMRAIRSYPHTIVRNYLLLQAYLWQRPSEVREAPSDEFDLDEAVWRIPPHRLGRKGGDEHWVPLPRQAVDLVRKQHGVVGRSGLLFPGRVYNASISENTALKALHTLGFKGRHTPHGFRAMARTICEEVLGIEAKVLEKQLSHEYDPSGLGGAYNRAEYWALRVDAMQRWADWLDAQV